MNILAISVGLSLLLVMIMSGCQSTGLPESSNSPDSFGTNDHAEQGMRFHEPSDAESRRYAKAAAVASIIEGEADLRIAFNKDKDKTRLVMILSPT